ncbi:tRNA lysidine(34) synthetase TilS [Leuconostoc rapi]|uniref:tRNA lysidine(34) synthetase TilS n=1 Tax=Leuconostoc rapi TaxID=1406906 RepID=UPI00195DB224|nr:tRNA lysidine(34) synthetase TilS [Leuconostoc rapi]MBM7435332.1 tRNA(Ile)-lysidine synthase [Leuconostoc rapi]
MINKIQKQLQNYNWGDTVIVAVSGGVDSVVLLHTLRKQLPTAKLVIAHVNYHLRQESDADELFVRHLAEKYQAIFEYTTWTDIPNTAVEGKARQLRYLFFEKLAHQYHTETIVVAHHADDQAETVLLKLVRGGQIAQLAGMAHQNSHITRPFLGITKQELLDYAQNNRLTWRDDKTNYDASYTPRNFFRNQIIPELKTINPKVVAHINDFAKQIQAHNALITAQTDIYVQQIENHWQSIPPIWLEPTIKRFIQKKGVYQFKQAQISQIRHLLENKQKPIGAVQLSKNIKFVKSYQQIDLKNMTKVTNKTQVLSSVMLKLNQWQNFSKNTVLWTDIQPTEGLKSFSFGLRQNTSPLYLRPVKTSDKIALIYGHKKIRRLAIDEKLTVAERQEMQVLATRDDDVIAVKIRQQWRVNDDFVGKQDAKPYWLAWRIEEK